MKDLGKPGAGELHARFDERGLETEPGLGTAAPAAVCVDSAGPIGHRASPRLYRAWKERLQVQICDRFGLTVTVCHYPTGCSKWNPIEHRLFSQISCNWAGVPLRTWDTLLAFIRGTTTRSGLTVQAVLERGEYPTGQKITDAQMDALRIERHAVCPQWNYTIRPRTPA